MTADVDELLMIARETIGKVRFCFAATLAGSGGMNARVVEPGKLDDDWRVWFMTNRGSRKVREIEASGKLLLGFQYDPEGTCVTLQGEAKLNDDVVSKHAVWTAEADRWFPGGPDDPEVVLVELFTERIELWSAARNVMPGNGSARLDRDGSTWAYSTT